MYVVDKPASLLYFRYSNPKTAIRQYPINFTKKPVYSFVFLVNTTVKGTNEKIKGVWNKAFEPIKLILHFYLTHLLVCNADAIIKRHNSVRSHCDLWKQSFSSTGNERFSNINPKEQKQANNDSLSLMYLWWTPYISHQNIIWLLNPKHQFIVIQWRRKKGKVEPQYSGIGNWRTGTYVSLKNGV